MLERALAGLKSLKKVPELTRVLASMARDKAQGKAIVAYDLSSVNFVQFLQPIHRSLCQRGADLAFYLASQLPDAHELDAFGIPRERRLDRELMRRLPLVDLAIFTEIYSKTHARTIKVFAGHGQPNKHTRWPAELLRNFEVYFLYGELEREMFSVIQREEPEATRGVRLMNIGYPKLDAMLNGAYSREDTLRRLGLDPALRTVIYAPAWDPGSSLRAHGLEVPRTLLQLGDINVIVKLHPVSLEHKDSPHYLYYTAGLDWRRAFSALDGEPRFAFVSAASEVNPYLSASDLLVTDFSGVALEFMALDRPAVFLHSPVFYDATLPSWGCDPVAALEDDRFNAGRNAGAVAASLSELGGVVRHQLDHPHEKAAERARLMSRFLYNPGKGSAAAADAVLELLGDRAGFETMRAARAAQ